jgi:hypothetical protein
MRWLRRADDTGSMPLAMLITAVGVSLSAILASLLATQMSNSRRALEAAQALDAAHAGLDVALGHIRTANDGTLVDGTDLRGLLSGLPCGPYTGTVADESVASYSVTIAYLDANGSPIVCLGGSGTVVTPDTARLTAEGRASAGGPKRTLHATYVFRLTNENIAGGLVRVYETSGSKQLCLDAGSSAPNANTAVTVRTCVPGSDQQTFAYTRDLNLVVVSSIDNGSPNGMCLDAGPVPHVENSPVVFQPCAATKVARQQWSFNDGANFEGTANGATLDGFCFHVQFPDTVGSPMVVRNAGGRCRTAYNNESTFSPEPQVGAGAASAASTQLVNYGQFGRCLDVTEGNTSYQYMIVWPCKQSPDMALVSWNQRWTIPASGGATGATGVLKVQPTNSTTLCLRSPLTNTPDSFVDLTTCPAGAPTGNVRWTVYGNTDDYATSYRIMDNAGNCLAANDPSRTLYPNGQKVSPAVVVPCSGSLLQKWNADPEVLVPAPLRDVREE